MPKEPATKRTIAFIDGQNLFHAARINHTDWIRIDRATYDACIDPRDYRSVR